MKSLFIALVILMLSGVLVKGETFFVSKKGRDSNPGTEEKPWQTITKAIKTVKPGDNVYVKPGIYRKWYVITKSGTETAPITFKAYGGSPVIIDGAVIKKGFTLVSGMKHTYELNTNQVYRVFENINTEYVKKDSFYEVEKSPGSWCWNSETHKLYIHTTTGKNPSYFQIEVSYSQGGFTLLDASYIIINGFIARHQRYASFSAQGNAHHVTFQNCVAMGGGFWTGANVHHINFINCLSYKGGFGMHGSNNKIINCVAYKSMPGFDVASDVSHLTIHNCIAYACPTSLTVAVGAKGFNFDYNDWFSHPGEVGIRWQKETNDYIYFSSINDYQTYSGQGKHSISADPQFVSVDFPNFDFSLKNESPCKGAGIPLGIDIGLQIKSLPSYGRGANLKVTSPSE